MILVQKSSFILLKSISNHSHEANYLIVLPDSANCQQQENVLFFNDKSRLYSTSSLKNKPALELGESVKAANLFFRVPLRKFI